MFKNDLLAGKKILITGGGTGLGKSIGRRYLELGAHLVICGRRKEVLDATADEFRAALPGAKVDTMGCDVRDADQVEAMMEAIWHTGALDVLVCNAAANFIARTDKLSARAVDAVLGIVLHGSFYCTIAAGRRWIEAGRAGNVISTVSAPVITGQAFTAASAAAKAGVLAMMRSLATEWAVYGIRLNALAPGPFPTDGAFSRLMPGSELERQALRRVPGKRFGEHWELTNLVAYLMSDASPYHTGDLVTLDGGEALFSGQQFAGFAHMDRAAAKEMMAALKPKR
jgi:NAD(P)-dependent dehydrogenase (short-subunit alcohol dehydrogenase family)